MKRLSQSLLSFLLISTIITTGTAQANDTTVIAMIAQKQVQEKKAKIEKRILLGRIGSYATKGALIAGAIALVGYFGHSKYKSWKANKLEAEKAAKEVVKAEPLVQTVQDKEAAIVVPADLSLSDIYKQNAASNMKTDEMFAIMQQAQQSTGPTGVKGFLKGLASDAGGVVKTMLVIGVVSAAISPVMSGLRFAISPNTKFEHIGAFVKAETSLEQVRKLMLEYSQMILSSRQTREYYCQALISSYNEFVTQVTTIAGYMSYRAEKFNKEKKVSKSTQGTSLTNFVIELTNSCGAEIQDIVNSNDDKRIMIIPDLLKNLYGAMDNELQRFLVLENHPEAKELFNQGHSMSQEDLFKLLAQQGNF